MNSDNMLKEYQKSEKWCNMKKKKLFRKFLDKLLLQIIMLWRVLSSIIRK